MLCDFLDNQETHSDTSDGDLVLLVVDSRSSKREIKTQQVKALAMPNQTIAMSRPDNWDN